MSLAILCSGQGTQHPDMFALTGEAPKAAGIFAAATAALGRDPRLLVRDVHASLHDNTTGQILCCTQALAAFVALKDALGSRLVLAGYSVGELASWGCAGLFEPGMLIELAAQRAAAMNDASGPHDGLAYTRGLRRETVDRLCADHGAAIAIVNPGAMFVVGGARDALDALCQAAERAGATKVGILEVAVASHTAKLAAARAAFRAALPRPSARLAPGRRLLSGIDGESVIQLDRGLDKLAAQISQEIDWAACLEACAEAGVTAALELGPGNALATMMAGAYPSIDARSLDDFRSLSGVEAWLSKRMTRDG